MRILAGVVLAVWLMAWFLGQEAGSRCRDVPLRPIDLVGVIVVAAGIVLTILFAMIVMTTPSQDGKEG